MQADIKTYNPSQIEIKLSHSDITFKCIYPDTNPPNAIDDITNVLQHLGVFDSIEPKNE